MILNLTIVETEVQINPKMIVLAREARGISQKELAEKLGTSPSFICKAETDNRTLTEDTLIKMSKLLKFPVEFFYQEGEANLPMSLSYRKRDHVSAKLLVPLEANINLYRLHIEIISEKLKLKEANVPVLD